MRTLVLLVASLALLTFVPTADAQTAGSLVITISAPDAPVRAGETVTLVGVATLTADYTAALGLAGIPVSYWVEQAPAWASVIISPSNDVFPPPAGPQQAGLTYTAVRTFTITVSATASEAPTEDVVEALTIAALTSPAALGQQLSGQGAAAIAFDATDEPCEHAVDAELLALAREAANESAASKQNGVDMPTSAPPTDAPADDLEVQTGGVSPLSLPWLAVAGFALVGAGVGLVLKKRLGR